MVRFALKFTIDPNPFKVRVEFVPLDVAINVTVAPELISIDEFIVAKALNVMLAAAVICICCITILFTKFKVAA